jgi:hypothetical protein
VRASSSLSQKGETRSGATDKIGATPLTCEFKKVERRSLSLVDSLRNENDGGDDHEEHNNTT